MIWPTLASVPITCFMEVWGMIFNRAVPICSDGNIFYFTINILRVIGLTM
jgi:hypothetical protein